MRELQVADERLRGIAEKVVGGEALSFEDGVALYRTRDIFGVGRMADFVRRRLHGDVTYYNRNRHINYTNVCALSCKFCSFYRKRGEAGAYEMPVEQVVSVAVKAAEGGATEVHVVGGLHPWAKFDYYLDMLRGIRSAAPGLHIKAFTAIEIVHFSRISRMPVREVLSALKEAGLGSLPGGGAEIFDDRVHDEAFKGKVRADRWFDVHRTAHALGLFSNATILYGHIEGVEERVTHFLKLRELQAESLEAAGLDPQEAPASERSPSWDLGLDAPRSRRDREISDLKTSSAQAGRAVSGGLTVATPPNPKSQVPNPKSPPTRAYFNCVIPLSFIPEHSELGYLPGPTGLTDLRTLAVARLMLNNFAHVKAFWIMQGVGLSQLALDWGCDDLDGTVVWYDITKRGSGGSSGGSGLGGNHQEMHEKDLRRLIREAGKRPVERDTIYRPVYRG